MFGLGKKPSGSKITFKISGMHCTSCAMNIDGQLEDTDGVISSNTSYAKSTTTIHYDPAKLNQSQLINIISSTGYQASEIQ